MDVLSEIFFYEKSPKNSIGICEKPTIENESIT